MSRDYRDDRDRDRDRYSDRDRDRDRRDDRRDDRRGDRDEGYNRDRGGDRDRQGGSNFRRDYGGNRSHQGGYDRGQQGSSRDFKFKEEMKEPMTSAELRTAAEGVDIEANCFQMDFSRLVPMIYRYHIDILSITDRREIDLTRGITGDLASYRNRLTLTTIFTYLLKQYLPRDVNPSSVIYDGGNTVYAAAPLPLQGTFELDPKKLHEYLEDRAARDDRSSAKIEDFFFAGAHCKTIKVVFSDPKPKQGEEAKPCMFATSTDYKSDTINDTKQFLEILTSTNLVYGKGCLVFNNSFFNISERNDRDIGLGKIVKSGFEKNCRIVEIDDKSTIVLQLRIKKSPFTKELEVISLAKEMLGCRDDRDLKGALKVKRNVELLRNQLKGLYVSPMHIGGRNTIKVMDLQKKSATEQTFPWKDDNISVYDFFQIQHKKALEFDEAPLVVQKSRGQSCFHPLEVLKVVKGQKVSENKHTKATREKMITLTKMSPKDMRAEIGNLLEQVEVSNTNPYLRAFGVSVSPRTLIVAARRLFPPAVEYGRRKVEPRKTEIEWKLGKDDMFIKAAVVSKTIYVIVYDRCMTEEEAKRFMRALCDTGRSHGMKMDSNLVRVDRLHSELETDTGEYICERRDKAAIIFGITKDKFNSIHDSLKYYEARYGVPTQHIAEFTARKALGDRGAFMVLGNLIMKTNVKLGGINTRISLSQDFLKANPGISQASIFPKGRMIIGLDVSHAGEQYGMLKQLEIAPTEPSVIGMAYSVSYETDLRGTFWYQTPLQATITQLKEQTKEALSRYQREHKKLPEEIIVFRGGVSEGEFDKVKKEMDEMGEAFPEMAPKYRPSITCICVASNSNYRLFPASKYNQGNVLPGTIVDGGITHPAYEEFIMIGHKAFQGTSRPVRCTVVVKKQGETGRLLNPVEIQNLTYSSCHGHQVFCGSTSIPSVLYAATNLSKRGRANWKTADTADSEAGSAVSKMCGGGKFRGDGSSDFFLKLSDDLKPKVDTAFWA